MTHNTGTRRYLLDGYIGSDKYTSVFCLGLCNVWGNIWTWIFGMSIISDGSDAYVHASFENYNYHSSFTWVTTSQNADYSTIKINLMNCNYVELSYNLPTETYWYRYLGTSDVYTDSGVEQIIGLPAKSSSTGGQTTGLCDYFYSPNISVTNSISCAVRGGNTNAAAAGIFYYLINQNLDTTSGSIGFRTMLISA